jgi:hypothetical protein
MCTERESPHQSSVYLASHIGIEMDSGFSDLSGRFNSARVNLRFRSSSLSDEKCALSSVFVPQLATLPTDNSTSEWDNLKYLIDHFDSSSEYTDDLILSSTLIFACEFAGVEDSISFAIFSLSIVGFTLLTLYTVIRNDCMLLFDIKIVSRGLAALLVRCR